MVEHCSPDAGQHRAGAYHGTVRGDEDGLGHRSPLHASSGRIPGGGAIRVQTTQQTFSLRVLSIDFDLVPGGRGLLEPDWTLAAVRCPDEAGQAAAPAG